MPGKPARPGYRSPWPWLLAIPPASAVVFWAVIITTMAGPPEMVTDASRRAGLVYTGGQDSSAAVTSGRLRRQADGRELAVVLRDAQPAPANLVLEFHAADDPAGERVALQPDASGIYRGRLPAGTDTGATVSLAPPGADWRLAARLPAAGGDTELTAELP